jgi:hypothetical protein
VAGQRSLAEVPADRGVAADRGRDVGLPHKTAFTAAPEAERGRSALDFLSQLLRGTPVTLTLPP